MKPTNTVKDVIIIGLSKKPNENTRARVEKIGSKLKVDIQDYNMPHIDISFVESPTEASTSDFSRQPSY